MRPILLVLLAACAPDATEADASPEACADGFLRAADGNCYPLDEGDGDGDDGTDGGEGVASVDDVLAALPACEPLAPGDALDVDAGCAGGVCASGDYDAWVAVLGEADDCTAYRFESDSWSSSYLS